MPCVRLGSRRCTGGAAPFAPVGAGILIGAASSAAMGLATDNLNPRSVAISGAFGAVPGGTSVRTAFAVGVGESVASQVLVDGRGLNEINIGEALFEGTFNAAIPFLTSRGTADVVPHGPSDDLLRIAPTSQSPVAGFSDHVVLGKSIGLEDQAAKIGGRHLMGATEWQSDVLVAISDPNIRISVALDGLEGVGPAHSRVMSAVQRASSGQGSPFDWELMQLHQNGRLPTTEFYDEGSALTNPFG